MSEDNPVVSEGKVVVFHYTVSDEDGEVIESSKEIGQPMPYLYGTGHIVPGLEKALDGRSAGDEFEVEVSPADGYGERDKGAPSTVSRDQFPDHVDLHEGMHFTAEGEGGHEIPLWITGIDGDEITVDPNHPLAGETLNFDVEVLNVRDANDEEIEHGHAHGPDGKSGH